MWIVKCTLKHGKGYEYIMTPWNNWVPESTPADYFLVFDDKDEADISAYDAAYRNRDYNVSVQEYS